MAFQYGVRTLAEILDRPLTVSRISEAIHPKHRRFFPGWSAAYAQDRRNAVAYRFGPMISEPGIAERWKAYEESYRSHRRITDFWVTCLRGAIVEPTNLSILGNDFVLRDTILSAALLRGIFGDVTDEASRHALRTPSAMLTTGKDLVPRQRVDEAFLLGFGKYKNYFNWTLRYASRLQLLDGFAPGMKLLVPDPKIGFIAKTLRFFGISEERIVPVTAPLRVKKLHLCAPFALGRYELSPHMLITLRENPRVTQLADTGVKRLYIPRVNVKMRRVVNEAAVIERLSALGFQVFDNAEYSIEDQARGFRSADIVVAPHGAGLSNIVYSRPGTAVVEIIPEGYDQGVTSYRSLADLLGLRYLPLFAREATVDRRGNRCNSDIEIDVDELVPVVESLL